MKNPMRRLLGPEEDTVTDRDLKPENVMVRDVEADDSEGCREAAYTLALRLLFPGTVRDGPCSECQRDETHEESCVKFLGVNERDPGLGHFMRGGR